MGLISKERAAGRRTLQAPLAKLRKSGENLTSAETIHRSLEFLRTQLGKADG